MKKVTDCGVLEKWYIGISSYIASTKTSLLYTATINARICQRCLVVACGSLDLVYRLDPRVKEKCNIQR